jgi:hypothetical protein
MKAATINGTKEIDVHLFVYDQDNKEVGKDESPGPRCEVKFTSAKDGKYRFLVNNAGGTTSVARAVKASK